MLGPFFEDHVLGIMAHFSDTINDGLDSQPMLEKLRCLGAIREMLTLAKNHISSGLPQVVWHCFLFPVHANNRVDLGLSTVCHPE